MIKAYNFNPLNFTVDLSHYYTYLKISAINLQPFMTYKIIPYSFA